jgi:hypothetical protein
MNLLALLSTAGVRRSLIHAASRASLPDRDGPVSAIAPDLADRVLARANGWKQGDASDERAQALSEILQSPAIHSLDCRYPDFRNTAGVARKILNIASKHPTYRVRPATATSSTRKYSKTSSPTLTGCTP